MTSTNTALSRLGRDLFRRVSISVYAWPLEFCLFFGPLRIAPDEGDFLLDDFAVGGVLLSLKGAESIGGDGSIIVIGKERLCCGDRIGY